MKTFYIETDKYGQVLHDFSFHLLKAIEFHLWRYQDEGYNVLLSNGKDMPANKSWIPVGSVPFVLKSISNGVDKVTPLNVPEILLARRFTKREVLKNQTLVDIAQKERPVFIKESLIYKGVTDILYPESVLAEYPDTLYDVSEIIDIHSEWRVFIHQDDIVGVKSYGSDSMIPMVPNEAFIKEMVSVIYEYRMKGGIFPLSYTLDVGVNAKDGTFLIECHPFVSCGLYGFADYQRLPSMFIQGYRFLENQSRF